MDYRSNASSGRAGSLGLLFLRIIPFTLLPVFHGWGKLEGAIKYFFGGQEWTFIGSVEKLGFPFPVFFATAAAMAESVLCLLLVFGLLTRFSAGIVAFNFMVAVYAHIIKDWKIELAAMYLVVSLSLLLLGPGAISVDSWIKNRRKKSGTT